MKKNLNISRKDGQVRVETDHVTIQINEQCKTEEDRTERRIARNKELVEKYPIGSYVKKGEKGVTKRIVEVRIDHYHYDRPTFVMISMKTKATTFIASDKIGAYTIIQI